MADDFLTESEVSGFDWDRGNREKCRIHGVTVASIEDLFRRPLVVFPDLAHSQKEERFKAIGTGLDGRHIFLVFTLRTRAGEMLIRPISARYMHKKEVAHYEKEIAKASQRQGSRALRRDR
jgi:uncharacterized DUF497 family protein